MKYLNILILSLLVNSLIAQTDSIAIDSFSKYFQINFGLSYGNLIGDVSEFTNQGGSIDMHFANGKKNHVYGFNMNILLSNKVKEFSIPIGYEHYDNPATVFFGFFYGQTFGNVHKSHFQTSVGLNYSWLLHRKQDNDIGGYHGLAPQIELSRSIRIGKTIYSEYQYTSQYSPMKYDPSLSESFIDIFVGYKQLLLNNKEGKGGLITIGVRYKLNKYSLNKNMVK